VCTCAARASLTQGAHGLTFAGLSSGSKRAVGAAWTTLPPTMNRSGDAASEPRRLLALEHANRIRGIRAELKRRLRSGEIAAGEVVLRCSRDTDTMTVGALLQSQPGWGPRRSSTTLRSVSLLETKTLGSLTERQRVMLASVLGREAAGPGAHDRQ
jgi:hypothetical protein